MCCSTLKIGKILFILGIYLLQLGKKHTFLILALGTIPVTGVGFIARKITEHIRFNWSDHDDNNTNTCIDVSMCYLVHNFETIFHLCKLLFCKYE